MREVKKEVQEVQELRRADAEMIRNLTQELKFVKENSAVDRQEQDQRVEGLKMALAEVDHFVIFTFCLSDYQKVRKNSSSEIRDYRSLHVVHVGMLCARGLLHTACGPAVRLANMHRHSLTSCVAAYAAGRYTL